MFNFDEDYNNYKAKKIFKILEDYSNDSSDHLRNELIEQIDECFSEKSKKTISVSFNKSKDISTNEFIANHFIEKYKDLIELNGNTSHADDKMIERIKDYLSMGWQH